MPLYALDAIDDAFAATRAFLMPFKWARWLRLALIVLFIGGIKSGINLQTGGTTTPTVPPLTPGGPADGFALSETFVAVLLVVAAVVVVALAILFIMSVMEFVFLESLRAEKVNVRQYVRWHWRAGLRLFGFRLLLGLVMLVLVALPVIGLFAALFRGADPGVGAILGTIFLLIPLMILVIAIAGLIYGFTTMFVAPIMLIEDRGVLSAWRRFWPTLRRQWKQYTVYVLVELGLSIGVGIGVLLVTALVFALVAIPAGLLGGLGVVVGLVVFGISLLIQVPVQTYFRYYALFVLGDTNARFDLIPDCRAVVRADAPSTAAN